MSVEINDDGLSVIGNGVVAIRFYDDDRALQKTIYLNADNELIAGGVTIEAPTTTPEAALIAAVLSAQPGGGTRQNYGWLANSRQLFGQAAGYWTENSIVVADWGVTPQGGPYISLDGANDYLTVADAAWQEVAANRMVVWHWVNTFTETTNRRRIVVGKALDDEVGWMLEFGIMPKAWKFGVDGDGLNASYVDVVSDRAVVIGRWTFIAGFFEPSQRIRIYVATNTDTTLTMTERTTDIPASIFNGAADLRLGANSDGTPGFRWYGQIGAGGMWLGPTAGDVGTYLQTVFDLTKARYGG